MKKFISAMLLFQLGLFIGVICGWFNVSLLFAFIPTLIVVAILFIVVLVVVAMNLYYGSTDDDLDDLVSDDKED